jgi:hypothetical protein
MFSVYLGSVDAEGPLRLSMTVAFVTQLQGFSNFLVFVRPQSTEFLAIRIDNLRRSVSKRTATTANSESPPNNGLPQDLAPIRSEVVTTAQVQSK